METKTFKLFIFSVFFSFQLYGEDQQINKKNFYITNESQITNKKSVGQDTPLQGVILEFNEIIKISNFDKIDRKKDISSSASRLQNNTELYLEPGEFIRIIDRSSIELLSDGSFFIQFSKMPNLEEFAIQNELIFVRDLSDINIGVFKVRNIYNLRPKIELISLDKNILNIKLNTVDPSEKSK